MSQTGHLIVIDNYDSEAPETQKFVCFSEFKKCEKRNYRDLDKLNRSLNCHEVIAYCKSGFLWYNNTRVDQENICRSMGLPPFVWNVFWARIQKSNCGNLNKLENSSNCNQDYFIWSAKTRVTSSIKFHTNKKRGGLACQRK